MGTDLQAKVQAAYSELAKERADWPNKYDMWLQCAKMLSDYALLSQVDLHGKSVLDIGGSEPVDATFWVDRVGKWVFLDINEAVTQVAMKLCEKALSPDLYKKLGFVQGDARCLPFADNLFDAVVSFSTIDHIPSEQGREAAIREMCRVAKVGGYVVVTVPNRWDVLYTHRSRRLQRQGTAIFAYEYQFSPLELREMLISNGCRIVSVASTNYNPLSHIDRLLRRIGLGRVPLYLGTRYGYLAQNVRRGKAA
jgi:ubiquinone/menaquinone biosynthesis C-methylase UbiE